MARRDDSRERPIGHDGKMPVPLPEDVLSAEQLDTYFDHLKQGAGPDLAARAIGMTGTQMRRLRRRDAAFAERFAEARTEGHAVYVDRLRATARLRATSEQGSDRILEVELATHVPGYEHLRRDRVKIDAKLEHAIVLEPEALDRLDGDQLRQLRELLAAAGGEIIDGTATEE